jgi:hypothetical protein
LARNIVHGLVFQQGQLSNSASRCLFLTVLPSRVVVSGQPPSVIRLPLVIRTEPGSFVGIFHTWPATFARSWDTAPLRPPCLSHGSFLATSRLPHQSCSGGCPFLLDSLSHSLSHSPLTKSRGLASLETHHSRHLRVTSRSHILQSILRPLRRNDSMPCIL